MRLFSRLVAGTSAMFLLIFAGVALIMVQTTRATIEDQTGDHAQIAATSLALKLSALGSLDDLGAVEATVNPVFDRGYYELVRVERSSGQVILEKRTERIAAEAPEWFVRLLPITPQAAQTLISTGWRELGRVTVVGHPHFAYLELWQSTVEVLGWLVALYLVATGATAMFMSTILRPLNDIESAARAISQREFRVIADIPGAPELAQTVLAMNGMSERLKAIVEEETANAERLRRLAHEDPVTGLLSRRGFEQAVQTQLDSPGEIRSGCLALLSISGFGPYNARVGYREADEFLADLAARLIAVDTPPNTARAIGRLGGATLAYALRDSTSSECEALGNRLLREGREVCEETAAELHCHVGLVHGRGSTARFSELLGAADAALAQARDKGLHAAHATEFGPARASGARAWGQRFRQVIDTKQVTAVGQELRDIRTEDVIHVEMLVRIPGDDGTILEAGQFLPMAARTGFIPSLDLAMLDIVAARLESAPAPQRYAINLSYLTLEDAAAVERLSQAARRHGAAIAFEITEFGALQDPDATQAFRRVVRAAGAQFGIDNFSLMPASVALMQALRPDYLKLARTQTGEVGHSDVGRLFVDAVVRMARAMEVKVFAQGVEDRALLSILADCGITGYQGHAAGAPHPLT